MKIVVNRCYGGFSVSDAVLDELGIHGKYRCRYLRNDAFGIKNSRHLAYRADKNLIAAIEKIGVEKSSGSCAKLEVVEIPDGIDWEIDEYDGHERIHETHRSW